MELTAHKVWVHKVWMEAASSEDDRQAQAPELAALVARAAAGDRAAFGEIMERHERRVLSVALRLMGTLDEAQDAAQEVFLRAFKYLPRFDARKSLEPWLVRMAVNVCRTALRKRGQRRSTFTTGFEWQHADPRSGPYDELHEKENRHLLHRALETLTERERTAIILRDLEGFSTAEVAGIVGSSESTVRVHISSARLKLRKALRAITGGAR